MTSPTERVAEVLTPIIGIQCACGRPARECHDRAAHIAEQIAAELQLTEEPGWLSSRNGVLHHAIVGWTAVEANP